MTQEQLIKNLIRLADAMYDAAQYLTTDASRLHKAMEDYHQFVINEYTTFYKPSSIEEFKRIIDNQKPQAKIGNVVISDKQDRESKKW